MHDDGADAIAIAHRVASQDIASLLTIHPNDVTLHDYEPPAKWASWWAWALDRSPVHTPAWLEVMRYFVRDCDGPSDDVNIPSDVRSLVNSVRNLQLQRTPSVYSTFASCGRAYRISPKKEHEVDRMSSYIRHLTLSEGPRSVWYAVDVGSGQGYLSRALRELDFHVLALDNDDNQTSGANRWTSKEAARKSKREQRIHFDGIRESRNSFSPPGLGSNTGQLGQIDPATPHIPQKGSLAHRTVHVCPQTLREAVTDWLINPPGLQTSAELNVHHLLPRREPLSVMLVALHACGSLTVDVLRAFLSYRAQAPPATEGERAWRPHSAVVVGCCYNLMSSSDFPLSKPLRNLDPTPKLTVAALHLAAQVPSQWLKDENTTRGAELALRKVVYRALLQPVLQSAAVQLNASADRATGSERPIQPGVGETHENRRLGKLNDKVYRDWATFLEHAVNKLGIDLAAIAPSLPDWFTHEAIRLKLESALYVLQTLRCILGPLIETLILLDRRDWIQEELAEIKDRGHEVEVEMVNLFDQATGSGRNVALVIKPATIPHEVCPVIERV